MSKYFFPKNPDLYRHPINAALLMIAVLCSCAITQAQTTDTTKAAPATLNLDDDGVAHDAAKQSEKDQPAPKPQDTLSNQSQLKESFDKAARHNSAPHVLEIPVAGSPQRVTKVTTPGSTYCVYTPGPGRTDGVDEIKDGEQNQVRSCPN